MLTAVLLVGAAWSEGLNLTVAQYRMILRAGPSQTGLRILGRVAEAHMERLDDAIRHQGRSIAVSRSTGQGHFLVGTMAALAWALLWRGRLAEAMEVALAASDATWLSAHGTAR